MTAPRRDPAHVLQIVKNSLNGSPPNGSTTVPEPGRFRLTDMGNGERLHLAHGADLRYCRQLGRWFLWDDRRFREDDTGAVVVRAKETVRSIYGEAADELDDKQRVAIAKHAKDSERLQRINAMITLAETEPEIPVRQDELDRDPWLFNVRNGTIDLRTAVLRSHARGDLITMLADIAYDPDATCPRFMAFLRRSLAENDELISFLQRFVGYCLTGLTIERILLILFGEGKNGKSTLLEVLRAIFGDYAIRTPTETLLSKRDQGIPNDVARLRGKRFVTASEAEEGQRLAEAKIKDLTGGDMLSARFMRAEYFDFMPAFKIILSTNHKPVIRGTDRAIWDRIRLLPFEVRIPLEEQDKHLRDKLIAEASGILAWAVQGCLDWQRYGLGEPVDMVDATEAYRTEMDVLAGFLEECCVLGPTEYATAADLYTAYLRWAESASEKPLTKTMFGRRLTEKNLDRVQQGQSRSWTWLGIGLRKEG